MTVNALTLQFLEWAAEAPRSHAEVMETWRSSCPRLSIWEDALQDGLVRYDGARRRVELTPRGLAALGRPLKRAAE
jgi:hypothetical protein